MADLSCIYTKDALCSITIERFNWKSVGARLESLIFSVADVHSGYANNVKPGVSHYYIVCMLSFLCYNLYGFVCYSAY